MVDRRKFLEGAAAAGALTLSSTPPALARQRLSNIGLQLYTVRQAMSEDMPGTLSQIADIGYQEVEFADYYGRSPGQVSSILSDHGLSAPSAHIPLDVFEGQFDYVLDTAFTIGHKFLVLPWLERKDRTLDRYKTLVDLLNAAGEKAHAAGMQVVYHHHDFEFMNVEGVRPFELLLTQTDSKLVQFQLDLYWLAVAKEDALSFIDRYPGRFPSVHVKDMGKNGEMVDIGEGILDFVPVFKASKRAGLKHYFVEHDTTKNPMKTAQTGFKALSELWF